MATKPIVGRPWTVGIDAGEKTGYAYFNDKGVLHIITTDFWTAVSYLKAHFLQAQKDGHELTVYIEDPAQIRAMYNKRLAGKALQTHTAIAQSVGGNKREATLLIRYCKDQLRCKCIPVKPAGRKWNAAALSHATGFEGRTSEHGRDAARLIAGR